MRKLALLLTCFLVVGQLAAKPKIKITRVDGFGGWIRENGGRTNIDLGFIEIDITRYDCTGEGSNCPGIVRVDGSFTINDQGNLISEQALSLVQLAVNDMNANVGEGNYYMGTSPIDVLRVMEYLAINPSYNYAEQNSDIIREFDGVYVFWNLKYNSHGTFVIVEREN
ncbi:MAG: hypothetical protein GXO48_09790 [Chlorobi bacterium]|nr:hypothetical protein [Chlorobiota bacterium]